MTFYNALANKGKMMKPYLVESIEKHGDIVEKRGPSILNSSICSKAVADTVRRALEAVTEDGTAKVLRNAKCKVAGKTGTSFATFEGGGYADAQGRHKYQGTFVGFFPSDDPQYSVICTIYSKPTHQHFQGGGIPARAVKTIVDEAYSMDGRWREEVPAGGTLPSFGKGAGQAAPGQVPDVKGLGLRDAVEAIESAGYKCSFKGIGHVTSQSVAAGTAAAAGTTVELILK